MPCLGAQPSHIGLRIVPTHTDDGISSGLRKPWRMPIAVRSNEAGGRINRNAAIGVRPTFAVRSNEAGSGCTSRNAVIGLRPIRLRHKLRVLISRHVKLANCELVSDRDQMLRYRASAKLIGEILARFFPR